MVTPVSKFAFFHDIIHVGAPHRRTLSLVHTCFFCFHFASVAVMAHTCLHSFSGPKTRSESRVFPLLATVSNPNANCH